MSPARKPSPAARSRRSSSGGGGGRWIALLIVLGLIGGVAWWVYPRLREQSRSTAVPASTSPVARAVPNAAPAPTPNVANTPAAAPKAVACWKPQPLSAGALTLAKTARFVTVEQLLGGKLKASPRQVYRVQAHLLGIQLLPDRSYLLHLSSVVNPSRTIDARIPAGACVANPDDGALYDELRQDMDLRFGSPQSQVVKPSPPAAVLITAPAVATPGHLSLEPVLDVSVQ